MKKKLLIGTLLIVTGVLGAGGYVYHQFDGTVSKLEAYLNTAAKMPNQVMRGYTELNVISFRDLRGFGGALGKRQAEEIAKTLEWEEAEQYNELQASPFFKQLEPDLIQCASEVHADNLKQIRQLKAFSQAYMINFQEYKAQMDHLEQNVLAKYECYSLLENTYPHKAKGIRHDS